MMQLPTSVMRVTKDTTVITRICYVEIVNFFYISFFILGHLISPTPSFPK